MKGWIVVCIILISTVFAGCTNEENEEAINNEESVSQDIKVEGVVVKKEQSKVEGSLRILLIQNVDKYDIKMDFEELIKKAKTNHDAIWYIVDEKVYDLVMEGQTILVESGNYQSESNPPIREAKNVKVLKEPIRK